jgi:Methyltransferase domain
MNANIRFTNLQKMKRMGPFQIGYQYYAAFVVIFLLIVLKHQSISSHGAKDSEPDKCQMFYDQLLKLHLESIEQRNLALSLNRFQSEKQAYDAFEPTWTCPIEQRIGAEFGDGGKFICGLDDYFRTKGCLVYSVGSSGDFSFEENIIKKFGCEVHTFDPTGNSPKWEADATALGVSYHSWGLSGTEGIMYNPDTDTNNPLYTMSQIVQKLGHENRFIDILKIDCEGCEWGAFAAIWRSSSNGV